MAGKCKKLWTLKIKPETLLKIDPIMDSRKNRIGLESGTNIVSLAYKILLCANKGLPRRIFRSEVLKLLINECGCDSIELRIIEHNRMWRGEYNLKDDFKFSILNKECRLDKSGNIVPCLNSESDLENIYEDIYSGKFNPTLPYFTKSGSFFTGNTELPFELDSETSKCTSGRSINIDCRYKSIMVIPLIIENKTYGLLIGKSLREDFFLAENIELYEEIAQMLGIAIEHRRAQIALRERIKELTCLFGIAKVAAQPDNDLESIIKNIINLLPLGVMYPNAAESRIVLDGKIYATDGFRKDSPKIGSSIYPFGISRGTVEVAYNTDMPELDEGPFLKEERNLIDAIAREISSIIERLEAQEEKESLQEQLRHADRLATIGQLAAGVAHELNEPLGSILGFAQLITKDINNPVQIKKDVNKIELASLHAREVIKKLMLFSRQSPQKKSIINLNDIVEEGLYFLESRCAKANITLIRENNKNLPDFIADKSQVYQILVNLMVNSIQAMPEGGTIWIKTSLDNGNAVLSVKDTGSGINKNILNKIFTPFFTTKDVDEGTGLGLAVVHGIVTSHGGQVQVISEQNKGAEFKIYLPISHGDKNEQIGK